MTVNADRRTQLLVLLWIASGLGACAGWSTLDSRRSNAISSQNDLNICEIELASMNSVDRSMPGGSVVDNDLAINRQLHAAAINSHLSDQLASIEPGTPSGKVDTGYTQTPIYVRLNAVSLMQLVGFLYELTITDHALSTTDIELSPPTGGPGGSTETWTADLTLSYLQYAKHPTQSR